MKSDLDLFRSWEGFLPSNAIVMGKRTPGDPSGSAATVGVHAPAARVPFFFLLATELRAETQELFVKIVQAMGYSPSQVGVGQEVPAVLDAQILVRMTGGSEAGRWSETRAGDHLVSTLTTHSLEDLLARPELKRETWTHLKTAAQKLAGPA